MAMEHSPQITQMIADQKDVLPRINANKHESTRKMSSFCGEICDLNGLPA
jgi:hypothetical protein